MKQSKEWIQKRVKANRINAQNNPQYGMKGKMHSKETKIRMALSATKRFESKNERNKIRESRIEMKFNDEHIENLKISHLGQISWNKGLKGVMPIPYNKGKKMPDYIRKKVSESLKGRIVWNKGKRMSKEMREKQSGSNSRFWKGGISSLSMLIRKSIEYKIWRKAVFERDEYTCLICGQVGGKINAHHIKLFSIILEENNIKTLEQARNCLELWNINNGITLCVDCHYLNK